jgi:hypothetical protein
MSLSHVNGSVGTENSIAGRCLRQGSCTRWTTKLLQRDLDGNAANGPEAYYDTVQNLTWIARPFSSASQMAGHGPTASRSDGATTGRGKVDSSM